MAPMSMAILARYRLVPRPAAAVIPVVWRMSRMIVRASSRPDILKVFR